MNINNLTEKRLYVNTLLQKTEGDDTDFKLTLQGTFNGVTKMTLNSITIDNYFLNLRDLSLEIQNVGVITIIPDYYLTKNDLVSYLNGFTTD